MCVAGHLDRKSRLSWEIVEIPFTEIQLHHGRVKEISPIFTVLAVLCFMVSVGRRAKSSAKFLLLRFGCSHGYSHSQNKVPWVILYFSTSIRKKKTEIRRPGKKKKKTVFLLYSAISSNPESSTKGKSSKCVDFFPPSVVDGIREIFCRPLCLERIQVLGICEISSGWSKHHPIEKSLWG